MSEIPSQPAVPHCIWCGDVIGVYEPAVVVVDGAARDTSLAAEPRWSGTWHHRDCFTEASAAA